METNKVRNILKDTRKNIKYVILAHRKLSREEMLYQLRMYNYNPQHLKVKSDSEVIIEAKDIK